MAQGATGRVACKGTWLGRMMVTDESAMRLLHATREQPEKAGLNPYQREYEAAVRYRSTTAT